MGLADRMSQLRAEADARPGRYQATTIGAVAELAAGVEIWTVEDGRRDHHGDPLGGIILHIQPGARVITDDGEIIDQPARYRTYDPFAPWPHRAFTTLTEPEINPASIQPATTLAMVTAIRRFCRHVAANKHRTLDPFDAELVAHAHHLVAVIQGGHP